MEPNDYRHTKINAGTGEVDYFYPMEINHPADREYAKAHHLTIARTRLGCRVFDAVMIPCTKPGQDYTPSEEQHRIYLELVKDELKWQNAAKQQGRCTIPDGKGGLKRCPCRIPNPNYKDGEPKTIPILCDGCKFEPFKDGRVHKCIPVDCIPNKQRDEYFHLRLEWLNFVEGRKPELLPLADLLTREYSKSEAARELGMPTSTIGDKSAKLKLLLQEFLGI